jgi:serine/threonine-protein kinase
MSTMNALEPHATPTQEDDPRLPAVEAATGRVGSVIGGTYRIKRPIGAGGSGQVFEVEHLRLGKRFALKLLRTELDPSKRMAQRFRREARAIAPLRSEHVVSVIDCGELDDHTPYLVMELLDGEDLRSLLAREGILPFRRAVALMAEACYALGEVHAAGLVHRDLKPENLFVSRRSNGEDWCKVLDFGVAKMDSTLSTAPGVLVGTVRYMAPEQLRDPTAVNATTDVYGLGAVLYERLAGVPPFDGENIHEVMYLVINREPRPLSELNPSLPQALVELVHGCLAKDQAERPQNVDA